MRALPARNLRVGSWLYEVKFDGYRALAFKTGKESRLPSRNRTDFTSKYPQLIGGLKAYCAI